MNERSSHAYAKAHHHNPEHMLAIRQLLLVTSFHRFHDSFQVSLLLWEEGELEVEVDKEIQQRWPSDALLLQSFIRGRHFERSGWVWNFGSM